MNPTALLDSEEEPVLLPLPQGEGIGQAVSPSELFASPPAAEPLLASDQPAWRTDSLAASIAVLLVLSLVQRLVGFIRQVLVCRWLEPNQLGEWDIAFRFLLLAAPVTVLGLPGSFGRYVEHYRRRGHLKTLLRQTTAACVLLCGVALILMSGLRTAFSELIYGVPDQTDMVLLLGVSLVAVVAYNFLTEMLTALRMVRVVSIVQFFNAVAFALLSVGLVFGWRRDAHAIVAAYALSSLLLVVPTLYWFRKTWRCIPEPTETLAHRDMWGKLLPFAASVWMMNLLYNLVGVVDRYMIIHYAPAPDPLTLVGYYHSSQVVPALMVSMAGLIGGILLPHLSHDWEAGGRAAVAAKINLALKLLGLTMFAASALVLLAAPLLFGVMLEGKYAGGQQILPWTLIYCTWMALVPMAQMYLWCAERARLPSFALIAGLVVNVLLCRWLLPLYGLPGVAWATAAANFVGLSLIYLCNRWLGMHVERGTWLVTLLPVLLGFGPLVALAAVGVVALEIATGNWLLNRDEKQQIIAVYRHYTAGRLHRNTTP